jgi:toxin FitB
MRCLLDTNIISNAIKPQPSNALLAWWAEKMDEDLFVAPLTMAEIWRGILEMPRGKKRDALQAWFWGQTDRKSYSLAGSCRSMARRP